MARLTYGLYGKPTYRDRFVAAFFSLMAWEIKNRNNPEYDGARMRTWKKVQYKENQLRDKFGITYKDWRCEI